MQFYQTLRNDRRMIDMVKLAFLIKAPRMSILKTFSKLFSTPTELEAAELIHLLRFSNKPRLLNKEARDSDPVRLVLASRFPCIPETRLGLNSGQNDLPNDVQV